MSNHPITPPPELVNEWITEAHRQDCVQSIAIDAAQWGADQELEACEKWLSARTGFMDAHDLRTARRPNPPSLKEQALSELNLTADPDGAELSRTQVELILKALEALPND